MRRPVRHRNPRSGGRGWARHAAGFDYADYRGASRAELTARWPVFVEEIARLTPRG